MPASAPSSTAERWPLQLASHGVGPFLQRDYWAVIDECGWKPSQIIELVGRRFPEFPPPELVHFEHRSDPATGLDVGDELDIQIHLTGHCRVRVVHKSLCSFTLATLKGHPEAGRITFGAYRNDRRDPIFHIRSRVRSSTPPMHLGLLTGGEPMQTSTWTDFVNNVALTVGNGVIGFIRVHTRRLDDAELAKEPEAANGPTYIARGD